MPRTCGARRKQRAKRWRRVRPAPRARGARSAFHARLRPRACRPHMFGEAAPLETAASFSRLPPQAKRRFQGTKSRSICRRVSPRRQRDTEAVDTALANPDSGLSPAGKRGFQITRDAHVRSRSFPRRQRGAPPRCAEERRQSLKHGQSAQTVENDAFRAFRAVRDARLEAFSGCACSRAPPVGPLCQQPAAPRDMRGSGACRHRRSLPQPMTFLAVAATFSAVKPNSWKRIL